MCLRERSAGSDRVALDGICLISADRYEARVAAWKGDGWYEVLVGFERFAAQQCSLLYSDRDVRSLERFQRLPVALVVNVHLMVFLDIESAV